MPGRKPRTTVRRHKKRGPKISKAVRKYVHRAIVGAPEHKYFARPFVGLQPVVGGNFLNISGIPQGLTDTTRIGDSVNLLSIETCYTLYINNALLFVDACFVRLIIFKWHPNDATVTPSLNDILDPLAVGATQICAPLSHDPRALFTMVMDKTLTLNEVNLLNHHSRRKKALKGKIKYQAATTNAIGQLYFLYLSDVVLAQAPTLNWFSRINYTDA